jgi:hypothetical protein
VSVAPAASRIRPLTRRRPQGCDCLWLALVVAVEVENEFARFLRIPFAGLLSFGAKRRPSKWCSAMWPGEL